MATPIPEKIGRYLIKSELGRGGMATVFRAHDPRFKRDVAIKVLPSQFLHDPMFRARFEREAQTIAALEHPAIVPVYDFGEENEQPYLVMRYMPGGSLEDKMKAGALSLGETVRIITRLADALDQVHSKGIVHRDLKPANVLFDQYGNAFLSDFGIARITQSSTMLTGDAIIGTPAYMSPEQARGDHEIDGRSDIYALGAILYQMLAGKQPYEATTPFGVAMKHITDPIPDIRAANASLPAASGHIIEKVLAKDPDRRYQNGKALASDLGTLAAQPSPAAGRAISQETLVEQPVPVVRTARPQQAVPSQRPITPPPIARQQAPAQIQSVRAPAAKPASKSPKWLWIGGGILLVGACVIAGILGAGGILALNPNAKETPVLPSATPEEEPTPFVAVENPVETEPLTPEETKQPRIVEDFFDDFSDPDSGWYRDSQAGAMTDYYNGGYRIFVDRPNMIYWATPNLQFTDVNIEVEAAKIAGADENYFGVICRYVDDYNFYMLSITSDGYYSIIKYKDGEFYMLGSDGMEYSESIHKGKTSNLLRAECVGKSLTLYVNGLVVKQVEDADFSAGDVGLTAAAFNLAGTDIRFDNFQASTP